MKKGISYIRPLSQFFGLVLLVSQGFSGQAQTLSLSQAMEQGVQNYPFLKAKKAEAKSIERRVQLAKTEYLPSIVVQDQYTFSTNNSIHGSFFPNEGTTISTSGGIRPEPVYQPTTGSFVSAVIDWRVVNFGRVKANVEVAQADWKRAQADYENELFQHQIRVIDAYLLLLIQQKLVEVQRTNLDRALTFKRVIDAGVQSGMRAAVDSSLATAEAVRARLSLLESQQRAQVQRLRLSELVGEVQKNLQVDSLGFYRTLPQTTFLSDSLSPKNPVLKLFQTQLSLSVARSNAIKRSGLPFISLVGAAWARGSGVSNAADVSDVADFSFSRGLGYQVSNYLVGVAARWSITNMLRVRQEYKSEQWQIDRFRYLYNEQSLRINRQNQEADTQLTMGLELAKQAPIQLKAAQQAYNQAKARYQSGLTDLPTLFQSFVTLNRAEIDGYVATSNAWRFLLLKAAAEGDLSLFMNQVK